MRIPALLAPIALALVLGACPGPRARPAPPDAPPAVAVNLDLLVIPLPPDPDARAAVARALDGLGRLAQRAARAGQEDPARGAGLDAAWARAHYLLDLFDDARFRRDAHSLELLHRVAGTAHGPARGPEATDAVLRALAVDVDRVLALDRLHAPGQAARTLLAFDAEPPAGRAQVFQRMGELAPIARGPGPLAANARLRLYGYCRQALADAMQARWADRMHMVAHCLYPLYDADPEPYFAADPSRRPPPPRWPDLVADLEDLLAPVAAGQGRLARAGQAARQDLTALATSAAEHLPVLPDPAALGLPGMAHAALYDFTPLLVLATDADLAALDDGEALTRAVQGDGRRTLTVALPAGAPAGQVLRAARAAQAAGAARLELAGVAEQVLKVPPGDYWAGRLPEGGRARRIAVQGLALATLDPGARPGVRTEHWDPDRAVLGLHLVVEAEVWVLAGSGGEVARLAAGGRGSGAAGNGGAAGTGGHGGTAGAVTALRAALDRVSRAFPGEDALILVPGRGATVDALAAAAGAAARDARGRPLMARIGLAERAPAPRPAPGKGRLSLAQRIERRAGATVDLEPEDLAARAPVVRRCYQDILETRPQAGGALRLELRAQGAEARVDIVEGPRDPALRRCVQDALAPLMSARSIASATARLRPRAE